MSKKEARFWTYKLRDPAPKWILYINLILMYFAIVGLLFAVLGGLGIALGIVPYFLLLLLYVRPMIVCIRRALKEKMKKEKRVFLTFDFHTPPKMWVLTIAIIIEFVNLGGAFIFFISQFLFLISALADFEFKISGFFILYACLILLYILALIRPKMSCLLMEHDKIK